MTPANARSAYARSLLKYCVAALVVASVLRLVSGRPDWNRAWFYVACVFLFQAGAGLWLLRVQPDMMAERSRIRPGTKSWDKLLLPLFAFLGPVAMWATAAADVRSHWPPVVPIGWSLAAFALCILGSALTVWAMRTNRFFSATVRIQKDRGHAVVSSGPYAYVRHPGYTGAGLFTLATPIALGSWIAAVPAALTFAVLALRTCLEDRALRAELAGYEAYSRRTRFRLIPGIW